jgi:inorganic pyrophosphatase
VCVSEPTFPGCIVIAKAVGLFKMSDEKGPDDHVVCVPVGDPGWRDYDHVDDLPRLLRAEISHFFAVYKDLDEGRYSEVGGWGGRDDAVEAIKKARQAFETRAK